MARSKAAGGRLSGRRVLVTGAASGMGKAIAETFAREGAELALLDVDAAGVEATASGLGAMGLQVDVACEEDVESAVGAAVARLGTLDGIVNAAGILRQSPVLETSAADWRRILDVNLMGPQFVCRHAAPELMKHPGATIVNICSNASLRPTLLCSAYSASKAALLSLTRSLAMELAPKVRANAVLPGPIRTPMIERLGEARPELSLAAMGAGKALGRVGEAHEVGDAALFLTSAESSFVTGESLVVDGGGLYW